MMPSFPLRQAGPRPFNWGTLMHACTRHYIVSLAAATRVDRCESHCLKFYTFVEYIQVAESRPAGVAARRAASTMTHVTRVDHRIAPPPPL